MRSSTPACRCTASDRNCECVHPEWGVAPASQSTFIHTDTIHIHTSVQIHLPHEPKITKPLSICDIFGICWLMLTFFHHYNQKWSAHTWHKIVLRARAVLWKLALFHSFSHTDKDFTLIRYWFLSILIMYSFTFYQMTNILTRLELFVKIHQLFQLIITV